MFTHLSSSFKKIAASIALFSLLFTSLPIGALTALATNEHVAQIDISSTTTGDLEVNQLRHFVLQAQDSSGNSTSTGSLMVTLSDGGNGGIFYNGSVGGDCGDTLGGNTITIASGTTQKAFCYSNSTANNYTITVEADNGSFVINNSVNVNVVDTSTPTSPVLTPEEFVAVDGSYKGISVGFRTEGFGTVTDVSVTMERADGSFVTKTANQGVIDIINQDTPGGDKLTAPFVIEEGSFTEANDTVYWDPAPATWNENTRPVEVTITVTDENGDKVAINSSFNDGDPSWPTYESLLPVPYSFPSTNQDNRDGTNPARSGVVGPHVNELATTVAGEAKLEFVNPLNYLACFEYRTDGDTSQALPSANPNPEISDQYPHLCLTASSTERVFVANDYVEVRSVFGAERDWDFDWTRFDVYNPDPNDNYQMTVSGEVYRDHKMNDCFGMTSCYDRAELLGEGWTINLYKELGTGEWQLEQSTDTNSNGNFAFAPVKNAGVYHVCEEVKAGWTQQVQNWPGTPYHIATENLSGNDEEGPYCRTINYTDTGNYSNKFYFGNVDTTKPFTEVVSPDSGTPHSSGTLVVNIKSTDGESGIAQAVANLHRVVGTSTQHVSPCANITVNPTESEYEFTCTVNIDSLAEGEYIIKTNARDASGNLSNTVSWNFIVDKTAPTIDVKPESVGDVNTMVFSTVSFKLYDLHKIDKVVINGTEKDLTDNQWSDVNGVEPGTFGAVEGHNTIVVYDVAGNTTTLEFVLNTGTVNTTSPIVTITSPTEGLVVSGEIEVTGTVTDDESLSHYVVTLYPGSTDLSNGMPHSSVIAVPGWGQVSTSATSTSFTRILDTTTLADGEYQIRVAARDADGNRDLSDPYNGGTTSVHIVKIIVDNEGPAVPTGLSWVDSNGNSISNGGTTELVSGIASWNANGEADFSHYIYRYWNNISTSSYNSEENAWTVNNGSNTSRSGSFNQGEGTHYFCIVAVDQAGNESNCSETFTINYETSPTTPPSFTFGTTTIRSEDLESGSRFDVVLTTNKWFFYNDNNGGPDGVEDINNSLGSFVNGPATAPMGVGSAEISVTGTERRNLATYQFRGTKLADITELKYSTYNASATNGGSANRSAYINFNVDFNGSDTWQSRLVFLPSDNGTVMQDSWQEWDALQGGDALWRYSGANWPITGESGSTPKTWNQILNDYPNIAIRSTDSWFGMRVGEPYANGYTENIDKFVIGIKSGNNTHTETYDFEPTPTTSNPNPDNNESENSTTSTRSSGGFWNSSFSSGPTPQVSGVSTDNNLYQLLEDIKGRLAAIMLTSYVSAQDNWTPSAAGRVLGIADTANAQEGNPTDSDEAIEEDDIVIEEETALAQEEGEVQRDITPWYHYIWWLILLALLIAAFIVWRRRNASGDLS